MDQLERWIATFLLTRRPTGIDGRKLYAYRITDGEYQNLKSCLLDCANQHLHHIQLHKIPLFCGAVVAYASEWWHREYQGGAWRWEPILGPVGLGKLDLSIRTEIIRRGLACWRLPPACSSGKAYFGAIVAQGGLPLFAIQAGTGANLGRVMTSVLRQAGCYRWNEQQISDAVGFQADAFAQSLRNEDFYALVALMISAALRLKDKYSLKDVKNPLVLLDAQYPDWKNEFPITVNDQAAVHLLNGLINEASRVAPTSGNAIFAVERSLSAKGNGIWELQSAIIHPSELSENDLTNFFDFHGDWPGYFMIDAEVSVRTELTHARSSLGTQEMSFKLVPQRCRWTDEAACEEHLLHLRGHAGDLLEKPRVIPGGNGISFSEPWIFTPDDNGWLLAITGYAQMRDAEILVAVDQAWTVAAADGTDDVLEDFGSLRFGNRERRLVRVHVGAVCVQSEDDVWDIRTGVVGHASNKYLLEGERVPLYTSPCPLFRGMPRVVYYDDEGQRREVSQRDIRLSRPGLKESISYQGASPGLVILSIEKDGERLGQLRFAILESVSRESWIPSKDPDQGDVSLSGWGRFCLGSGDANVTLQVEDDGASRRKIHFAVNGQPPDFVPVSFTWPGSRSPLRVRLPFPAAGGRAYDERERPIDAGSTVPLSRLLGKRILVFDSRPDSIAHYKVELTLFPSGGVPARKFPVKLERNKAEIRLSDYSQEIESLLAFSDNLDACVTITLTADREPKFRLHVSRYDTVLFRSATAVALAAEFMATLSSEQLEMVKVLAVPLISPDNPLPLTQNDTEGVLAGTWSVDDLPQQDPWLIVPAADSIISFRPAIVDRRGDVPFKGDDLCALAYAMPWPDPELRTMLIDSALEEMASDFANPSWDFLVRLGRSFRHLPLCSLDVFRRLALRPDLAVAILFAPQDDFRELARGLLHELGMVLEIAPISVWRKTVANLSTYYTQLLGEAAKDVLSTILENKFNELIQELPNHRLLLEILRVEAGGQPNEYCLEMQTAKNQAPDSFARRLWYGGDALVQSYLLRVHVNDQWPESPSFKDSVLPKLSKLLNEQALGIVQKNLASFFWRSGNNYKLSIVNIPAACALWAACSLDGGWWREPSRIYGLRVLRAFDPAWFDECYQATLASCFTFGLLK